MSGAGPAGEVTFADIRARLRRVSQMLADMESSADGHAAEAVTVRGQAGEGASGGG